MSRQPNADQPGRADEPAGDVPSEFRVGPRPLDQPPADAAQAAVFGRPDGVAGAFAARPVVPTGTNPGRSPGGNGRVDAPPEPLAVAFARPADAPDIVLQRAPDEVSPGQRDEPTSWSVAGDRDPWRDPAAGVRVGPPALDPADEPTAQRAEPRSATQLSVPELLFGRRVKPTALVFLLVCALALGAVGGVVGWALGSGGNSLTDANATVSSVDQNLERAPTSVAGIAQRVAPAVVSLEVTAGGNGDVGSGVVIDGGGYILTNNHVIAAAVGVPGSTITAVFAGGARVPAALVGRDSLTDLAVLKVNATNLTVLPLGTAANLQPGDAVIAIGSPLGLAGTVTSGIVSALHRPVTLTGEDGSPVAYDAIQTDAAINPGNSGGALVDATGALIGINSAIQTFGSSDSTGGSGSIGLGFAIPADQAKRTAQSLIRTGSVPHADLGVNVRSVSANTSLGAQVVNLRPGGAAAGGGLAVGDVITQVGDRRISGAADLTVVVLDHSPGDTVPVTFDRAGQQHTVQVVLQSD
ncbi:MAG TPA: trypsin-like peptidase domain-containing protein [Pseudonocardiaceae bacterium]|nr:trypsin-like peptidase domain-containing protein [Pseudonocardiaceae bacterium]